MFITTFSPNTQASPKVTLVQRCSGASRLAAFHDHRPAVGSMPGAHLGRREPPVSIPKLENRAHPGGGIWETPYPLLGGPGLGEISRTKHHSTPPGSAGRRRLQ